MELKRIHFFKLFVVLVVVAVGIFCRLKGYLENHSLFLDEAALALNIMNKGFLELFLPLDYGQVPPVGFALSAKVVTSCFGFSEYVLRLIPLLSSILAIFVFYFVVKKVFSGFLAQITSLALFSLNFPLAFFAQDFKQYSSDVLCILVAFWVIFSVDLKSLSLKKSLLLSGVLAGLIWCSHAAIFVVAGFGLVFLSKFLIKKEFSVLKNLTATFLLPFVSVVALYLVNLRGWHGDSRLLEYWQGGFSPFVPEVFFQNIMTGFVFLNESLPELVLKFYIAILLLWGAILLFRSGKTRFFLLLSPIILNMIAAELSLFPFKGRLILYLVPIFIIFLVKPLDIKNKLLKILAALVVLTLFKDSFLSYPKLLAENNIRFYRHETRPLYDVLVEKIKPDETIYLYHLIEKSFLFYDKDYHFSKNVFRGIEPFPQSINQLELLPKSKNVWFLFINDDYSASELPYFKKWIEKNCDTKEYYTSQGAFMIYAKVRPAQEF